MIARVFMALAACLACGASYSVEPLTSDALLRQCGIYARDSVTHEAVGCRAWIQGFIGGAFASRMAVIADKDKPETLTERAARQRMGRDRLEFGQNRRAGYCLPQSTTLDEIIAGLNAYAATLDKRPEFANQLMLGLLRSRYPCRTT